MPRHVLAGQARRVGPRRAGRRARLHRRQVVVWWGPGWRRSGVVERLQNHTALPAAQCTAPCDYSCSLRRKPYCSCTSGGRRRVANGLASPKQAGVTHQLRRPGIAGRPWLGAAVRCFDPRKSLPCPPSSSHDDPLLPAAARCGEGEHPACSIAHLPAARRPHCTHRVVLLGDRRSSSRHSLASGWCRRRHGASPAPLSEWSGRGVCGREKGVWLTRSRAGEQ